MFSKNMRHQRQLELIKNQPFIQLIGTTMKIISGSNYGTESSLLWEITVFCHWLQRSTLHSENTCYVTLANRIFEAKCVVAQNMLLRNYWFICRHLKIVQSQIMLTAKVSEHAIFQISVTLENTVSPANFNHWFRLVLKGINHSWRTRITIREYVKKSAILIVKYNEKIFSSTYYGARVLITFMVIIIIFFLLHRSSQYFNG